MKLMEKIEKIVAVVAFSPETSKVDLYIAALCYMFLLAWTSAAIHISYIKHVGKVLYSLATHTPHSLLSRVHSLDV